MSSKFRLIRNMFMANAIAERFHIYLPGLALIVITGLHSTESYSEIAKKRVDEKRGSQSLGDPMVLPIYAKPCTIQDDVRVASRIVSKNYYDARAEYMSTIESFKVVRGQAVQKGQILATTNTSTLEKMKSIYVDYVQLYLGQLAIAKSEQKLLVGRRDRLKDLAAKGIIPVSELEQADRQVIAGAQAEERILRGLEGMQTNVDGWSEQIKNSNFYSQMAGIVTELIVDPKSLTGNLNVMPGSLVAKVEQPGTYRAEAKLMDTQIHGLKVGMKAEVDLPDGSSETGKILFVSTLPLSEAKQPGAYDGNYTDPSIKQGIMSQYKAVIEFSRSGPILPSGLLANVRIVTSETKAKSCLPWNALEIVNGKSFAKTFKAGQGWSRMPVSIGRMGRYEVEINPPISDSLIIMSKLW